MGRNVLLLITTDQQRVDSLGCNGGTIARTPVADRLSRPKASTAPPGQDGIVVNVAD